MTELRGTGRARQAARALGSAPVLWAVLALPGVYMTYGYWQGAIFYGEFLHSSGELAAQLLILTMAVTPLGLLFPSARWTQWLRRRRRWFGVAVFGYSLLHAAVYVERQGALGPIVQDALAVAMWTGWAGLAVLLVLAATSNDLAVRRLGRGWKWLHRGVYAAAALTFAHWILSAFDPVPGIAHLGVLALLEGCRLWRKHLAPAKAVRARASGD